LRWFQPKPRASSQKSCSVCQPFAKKATDRARAKRLYSANPDKFRARARKHLPSTYREIDAKKYRTMQDAINARERAWRQTNPQKSAACSARYRRNNPEKAKQSQVKYHKGLHELAARGKKLRDGDPVALGDHILRPKGGRERKIEKAARVDQLCNQGMKWPDIQKQIAAEYKEYTTVDALQVLRRRHLRRVA
jgi:hypothetical protein